jgi:hypothetical protein
MNAASVAIVEADPENSGRAPPPKPNVHLQVTRERSRIVDMGTGNP